jgi:hypothetical protein
MENTPEQVQEILGRYDKENWELSVPQLQAEEVELVQDYMKHNNMIIVAGSIAIDTQKKIWGEGYSDRPDGLPSIGVVINYNQHAIAELDNHVDRVCGPYIFEDGTFWSKGIAVWGLRDAAIKRRALAVQE